MRRGWNGERRRGWDGDRRRREGWRKGERRRTRSAEENAMEGEGLEQRRLGFWKWRGEGFIGLQKKPFEQ